MFYLHIFIAGYGGKVYSPVPIQQLLIEDLELVKLAWVRCKPNFLAPRLSFSTYRIISLLLPTGEHKLMHICILGKLMLYLIRI